jgi:hypothetical protein
MLEPANRSNVERYQSAASFVVRCVIALNFVLFSFSFTAWFQGTEKIPGMADRLFGSYRFGGFRADFVWIVVSTVFIFFALLAFATSTRDARSVRINRWLCVAWIVACLIYLLKAVLTAELYFG